MARHTCRSTDELRSAIMQEMAVAMTKIRDKTEQKSNKYVSDYYSKGSPIIYERTYTLPNSAITTPLFISDSDIRFESSYDENRVNWSTGSFTPFEVISATEFHEAGVLGKSGYFERLENEIDPLINMMFKAQGFR